MIKGLKPSLAEGGKIKIGGLGEKRMKKGGNPKNPADWYRMPVKYDHFVVTTMRRDDEKLLVPDDDVMKALPKDTDGKTRSIPVILHEDDIDLVFPTAYTAYEGKSLWCSGDGVVALRRFKDQEPVAPYDVKCPCDKLGSTCKPHGTLHCSIALPGRAVAGSVYRWRTTSIISIQRMMGSLEQIRSIMGVLRGLPLWLRVEQVACNPMINGKRTQTTVPCCHLELRESDIVGLQHKALQAAEMRSRLQLPATDYRALVRVPGGSDEDEEEQDSVSQEFYSPDEDPAHDPETGEVVQGQVASDIVAEIPDLLTTAARIRVERELGGGETTSEAVTAERVVLWKEGCDKMLGRAIKRGETMADWETLKIHKWLTDIVGTGHH
jgi:hypothetical protein